MTEFADDRVLIVEDEEPILAGLVELFAAQGFVPDSAVDGVMALERLAANEYSLVILDLMIPQIDGLEVLRRRRAEGDYTPFLILTAKGAEEDVVAGLEAGADDYVTKPFGIKELVARAKGLLRRSTREPEALRCIRVGEVTIDSDRLRVSWSGGELRLTAREGALLSYLASRRHRVVTRVELLVDVWGYRDGSVRTRTVDVHVQQLRAKLAVVPGCADFIHTVRGRGYRFAPDLR